MRKAWLGAALSVAVALTLTAGVTNAFAQIKVGVSVSATGPAASLGIPEKNTSNTLAMSDVAAESGTPMISMAASAVLVEPVDAKRHWSRMASST